MTFITKLALEKRSVSLLIIILVAALGVYSYLTLEQELFPDIEFPNITIITFYPDSNPETIDRDITVPLEDSIKSIEGIRTIQSTSSESNSVILATFEFGEDMKEAERTIESSISSVRLPEFSTTPQVNRINNNQFPVMRLTIAGNRDIPSLQTVVDEMIIPEIESVSGVFRVDVSGQTDERVEIRIDDQKLEDTGLTRSDITLAVQNSNIDTSAGSLTDQGLQYPIKTSNKLTSLVELRELIIGHEKQWDPTTRSMRSYTDRPVYLTDVAAVLIDTDDATTISRTNGKPSLTLFILKDPDANTVDVTDGISEITQDIPNLPEDISILVLQNDGPEVEKSLAQLFGEGSVGFLFAISVVFIFLLNFRPSLLKGTQIAIRPTFIIACSIPLSVLTGVIFVNLYGISLNFMSLAGLAIAVGRVVDDSIVVLENIYRHIQMGESKYEAAIEATKEVGAAIVSSTLTTVAVFIPLTFIEGLVGQFFTPFAISVSFALLASTAVALTVVPVLSIFVLNAEKIRDSVDPTTDSSTYAQSVYLPILRWAINHKLLVIVAAVIISGSSLGLLRFIPATLFPPTESEYITLDLKLPTSSSIGQTFQEVLKTEAVLSQLEDEDIVRTYQVTIGASSNLQGIDAASAGYNLAGFFLTVDKTRQSETVEFLNNNLKLNESTEINIEGIGSGPPAEDLQVTLTGTNFTEINQAANTLVTGISNIEGVRNVTSDVKDSKPQIVIKPNLEEITAQQTSVSSIASQTNQMLVGRKISEIDINDTTLDILIISDIPDVDNINLIKGLNIETPSGQTKLGSLADIVIEDGPTSITRYDNERSISISGNITAKDTQGIGRKVDSVIETSELPPSVTVQTGGIFEQISEGFQDLYFAMFVGVILVYLVMVICLGSLRNPFIIILSLPLAIVGALVALTITDRTLSLSALMGFLLLIGVVVTNALVLLTFVEQLKDQGLNAYDAILEAGRIRLRPILMTAFTTTFALLPLALNSSAGDGGIIGAELATVVIGGLVSNTFLTLLVIPAIYLLFQNNGPGILTRVKNVTAKVFSR
ncbi:MAG: efflux RND transporter permease subunit [SAR202 cluster bacterium]|nr:efflux RND transporter permease subunit [SAR202 cluster bacterium]MQG87090.1 efflux RND transporter permease subunit [SAR202 cluster bacterium]